MIHLLELFDNPAPWKTTDRKSGYYEAEFDINGLLYQFTAHQTIDSPKWTIFFGLLSENGQSISDLTKSIGVSGMGHQFEVFATIREILLSFLRDEQPEVFKFSADEDSRQKLYRHFSKEIAKQLPYTLEINTEAWDEEYIFTRK